MLHFSRLKIMLTALVCLASLLFASPNFFSKERVAAWPSFMPKKQMALGLDLKGGAHLLLAMDTEALRQKWLTDLSRQVRVALNEYRKKDSKFQFTGIGVANNGVVVRLNNPADLEAGLREVRKLNESIGSALLGTAANRYEIKGEGTQITMAPTDAGVNDRITSAIGASLETIRRRVDSLGTSEASIVRQGRDRILVQVPGYEDTGTLKRIIGETAVLNFHKVHDTIGPQEVQSGRSVLGYRIFPADDKSDRGGASSYLLQIDPIVRGEDLVDSQQAFDSRTNEPVINFRFNQRAAVEFGRFTQNNIGRPFAIVLDEKVLSAPNIRGEILGGNGQISGNFTVESANELAIKLRSGALPAKLTIVEERTVGPSLGADSISAGAKAGLIGMVLTVLMTVVAYGTFGIIAVVGLAVHAIMILAMMTMIGSTLTLPGIAGFVLTISMAVDANVLIYERMREELRAGKSAIASIEAGFSRAFIAIFDSQLTTMAAAVIMFWLGSGPIRGFAVTLSLGIITSVFAAVTITRLLVSLWLKGERARSQKIEVPV
jgi:protein-export membrane protein SecD